jgi:hypothetical protein
MRANGWARDTVLRLNAYLYVEARLREMVYTDDPAGLNYYRGAVDGLDAVCLELRGVKVRPEHVGRLE